MDMDGLFRVCTSSPATRGSAGTARGRNLAGPCSRFPERPPGPTCCDTLCNSAIDTLPSSSCSKRWQTMVWQHRPHELLGPAKYEVRNSGLELPNPQNRLHLGRLDQTSNRYMGGEGGVASAEGRMGVIEVEGGGG